MVFLLTFNFAVTVKFQDKIKSVKFIHRYEYSSEQFIVCFEVLVDFAKHVRYLSRIVSVWLPHFLLVRVFVSPGISKRIVLTL